MIASEIASGTALSLAIPTFFLGCIDRSQTTVYIGHTETSTPSNSLPSTLTMVFANTTMHAIKLSALELLY